MSHLFHLIEKDLKKYTIFLLGKIYQFSENSNENFVKQNKSENCLCILSRKITHNFATICSLLCEGEGGGGLQILIYNAFVICYAFNKDINIILMQTDIFQVILV